MVGLPSGAVLCFLLAGGIFGLWWGLSLGLCFSVSVLACVVSRMDWQEQADKATARAKK